MNIRFLIAHLVILCLGLPSYSQWSSDFFPAVSTPERIKDSQSVIFKSDVLISNIIYAVDERRLVADILGSGNLSVDFVQLAALGDSRFIDQGQGSTVSKTLQIAKNYLKDDVGTYIDFTKTMHPTNYTPWTISNLLIYCQLPTNFFEFTPARNLSGNNWSGSPNNSEASDIADQGKNYGWDAMKKVIDCLIWTTAPVTYFETESGYECRGNIAGQYSSSTIYGSCEKTAIPYVNTGIDWGYSDCRDFVSTLFYTNCTLYSKTTYKQGTLKGANAALFANNAIMSVLSYSDNLIFNTKVNIWGLDISDDCPANSWAQIETISGNINTCLDGYMYFYGKNLPFAPAAPCSTLSNPNSGVLLEAVDASEIYDCETREVVESGTINFRNSSANGVSRQFAGFINWGFRFKN